MLTEALAEAGRRVRRRFLLYGFRMRCSLAARSRGKLVLAGVLRRLFRAELRQLHDTLARTSLAGRYWVWGGLLLGWAREGQPLAHDTMDADFGVFSEDAGAIEAARPALEQAGFRLLFRFRNNERTVTEYTFVRHGAKFEFFVFFPGPDPLTRRHFTYAPEGIELEAELKEQPLETFEFVGRTWLKPKFHERELSAIYGKWEVPDPTWSYETSPCIVTRRAWARIDGSWG